MNDLTLNCPKCGGQFIFSKELAGQEIACPHCSESILLPKTKPKMAWIFAAFFIFVVVCIASIVVWKHTAKHDITPQVLVAENTNSQAVVLQTGPLAIEQLLSAAKSGDVKTVKLLLDAGVDVNARGTNGATALMNAVWGTTLEITKLLLEKGADVNAIEQNRFSVLDEAVMSGKTDEVRLLLDNHAEIGNSLHFAAFDGSVEIIKLLLATGADINAVDDYRSTALMDAVREDKYEAVKFLLERGADVNAKDEDGSTALGFAVSDQTNVVELLLENGADINAKNDSGTTALTAAAYNGHMDMVKFLLDKGADVNAKDNDGTTALMEIVQMETSSPNLDPATGLPRTPTIEQQMDDMKICILLLDKGADINAKDTNSETALMWAAGNGDTNVVQLLLDKGAGINETNIAGSTALNCAAGAGKTDTVRLLLDRGADINANALLFYGTPLMEAAHDDKIEVVKLLLARGADINTKNSDGQTALGLAREMTNTTIAQLLQQAGATDSPASAVPTAAAVAPDKPEFEVISLTAKATEKNEVWWRYGYRLTIRNNGTDDNRQFFDIQFLDAEGYVIDTKPVYDIIKPGTADIITGDIMIKLPGAARVADIKAVWTYGN